MQLRDLAAAALASAGLRSKEVTARAPRPASARGAGAMFLLPLGALGVIRAQDGSKPAADVSPPAVTRYARVEVDQVPLRCFESDASPTYVDALARGDVVQVGEERNGFVAVTIPLGVTGYVHKKFATPPDEQGFVRTDGKRVSFRYRPRSTEAPADMLDDAVALHFMAEENDWYVVRNPRARGFVPVTALAFDVETAAGEAAWAAFETTRRGQWEKVTLERVAASQRAEQLRGLREELARITAQFRTEIGKPWGQQSRAAYTALEASVGKLAPNFDTGSTEQVTAQSLMQEIRKQVLVLDAQAVATETLPPTKLDVTVSKPAVSDPLARFDLVGWVRVTSSTMPSRSVRLVRGGRVLGYLICSNGRYDFAMFEGVEVGVVGPKEAAADGTWLLDVQRLEVLGVDAR